MTWLQALWLERCLASEYITRRGRAWPERVRSPSIVAWNIDSPVSALDMASRFSIGSVAKFALTAAQLGLLQSSSGVQAGSFESCPNNTPLRCQNSTTVENTCCFNAPGGQLLQTQFWDSSPATGPSDSWTVHGLW